MKGFVVYEKEKNKPLIKSIKINKNNINPKHSMELSSINKDNGNNTLRLKNLLFSNYNSFINHENKKEINNNLDIYNNDFKVNNYLKVNNQRHNMESVEWMYYNYLSKNILSNRGNMISKQNINMFPVNYFKYKNGIKKKFQFQNLFVNSPKKQIKSNKNKSAINRKKIVIEVKDKKIQERNNLNEEDNFNIITNKKRKLIQYYFLSQPGNHKGLKKINQDCYLKISNINNCENISIYTVINGHGPYGDKLSKEISEFFLDYFTQKNIFNTNENINPHMIDNKKLAIITSKKNNISQKIDFDSKNNFKIQKLKLINNKTDQKIIDTYEFLTKDNFIKLFESFSEIDKKLHQQYDENKKCDDSGTSINIIINFNSNNINKIISINIGNTKSILITDNKIIKELNIIHTPCVKEERIRIENHGGVIDRIDWLKVGPLRIWFKDKKFPGLTITRSLGDFEAIPLGILPIPDIKEYDIDEEKIKILVMATNDIWEFLTNDKIMDIVWQFYESKDAKGATEKVIETADKIWNIKNPYNIPDLTAGVFFFK